MIILSSINRLIKATFNSLDGFKSQWQNEAAFRQECYLCLIAIPVICVLHITASLKLLLVLLLMLLLLTETVNSAIETIVDRISLERHPQSKIAKDLGSAAVAIALLMNVIAWVFALLFHFNFIA